MGGRRGYGPTHSQSLEKHFLGVPGLRVLMMNPLLDAFSFLDALLTSSSGPNLLIENKANYGLSFLPLLPEGFKVFRSNHAVPHAAVVPDGRTKHVSLVSSAGMLAESLKAVEVLFRRHEIICQILCPSQLYPFRVEELQPWITEAPRVLFLEEGPGFSSFSSECLSQMGELGWPQQGRRLTAMDSVIPSARHLEAQIIPDAEAIVASVTSWLKR